MIDLFLTATDRGVLHFITEDMADFIKRDGGALLVGVSAVGTLAALIRRFNRRVIVPAVEKIEAMNDLVQHQLTHNEGTSLLDKVDRIDINHREAEKHWLALEAALRGVEDRLEKVEHITATAKEV